jgi:hypothetical protein
VRLPIEPTNSGELLEITAVLGDPAASSWLKTCLYSALSRDPVDVATTLKSSPNCWNVDATTSYPDAMPRDL